MQKIERNTPDYHNSYLFLIVRQFHPESLEEFILLYLGTDEAGVHFYPTSRDELDVVDADEDNWGDSD
jgi:hypothetical protein